MAGRLWVKSLLLGAIAASLVGCGHRSSNEGIGGLLGLASPQALSGSGAVGYVDIDAVVAAHPLHAQLQAMQDQIAVLQQEASLVPADMSPDQAAAYNRMQDELSAAEQKYQADLAARRSYYEQREAQAISQLQATALGTNPNAGGVLGGLRQQFGSQAQQMQKQAFDTLNSYRTELFKQDSDHLRSVQQLLAADVRGKMAQRQSQLSSAETKYQISLVKADQEQRLNLQAKLQNLALTDQQRSQYNAQLQALEASEQSKINAMKSRDNAELAALSRTLEAQATAKYNAERTATQAATQAKLLARQREVQNQIQPQLVALNGKFQAQLNQANQQLAGNPKYQSQAQNVHNQMQTSYVDEANKATAAYTTTRQALIARYSAIAHMQFQDNEAIAAQADKIAADRRDLYGKIVDQVRTQVADIAQRDGITVVFESVRGGGTAIDLTPQVTKAVAALQNATAAPAATSSGGS